MPWDSKEYKPAKVRPSYEEAREERRKKLKIGKPPTAKRVKPPKKAKPQRAFNRKMGAKGSDYRPGGAIDSEIRIEGPNADSDA